MAKAKWHKWVEKDNLILLEGWARDGLTDEQIAKNMGISTATLYNYKNNHVEILEALKKGKEVVDYEVENALLKRALGYEYQEKTYEAGQLTKVVTKQVAPDTTALIYWLKNRKPKNWRDKPIQDTDISSIAENFNNLTKSMIGNIAPTRKLEDFE